MKRSRNGQTKKSSSTASKYYGLSNQGATCYLNSVLQVLFMTEDFREAVKRHTCDTECIDPHLASLFDDLKGCTAYTYEITNHLGIDKVYEQRDAAEYFEKILGLTSPEASQIFHGQSTHKTKCSACCEETEAGGAFWYLPLALVDSNSEDYSVVDGIKEYFRTSDFSGENQMYCDKCEAKTDATIKCVIKHHPEVLMLLLKRFEFDYSYMRYVKNNRTVDVPYTLQIPENQTYELYAVVDHFGGLRGGHYNATIKPQEEERWYNFNDDKVTLKQRKYQPFQADTIEKSGSAYLLFYRKKTVRAVGACTQDREVSIPEEFPPATNDNYDQGPDVIKGKEREEVEEAAEVGNEPTVTVSIDQHEETGIKDIVSVVSRGGGLSSDIYNVVEDQDSGVYAKRSKRNDLHYLQDARAEKQRHKGDIMSDDEEDMGGNAQADDQGEKRETLSRETLFEVRDDRDSGRLDDVRHRRPQAGMEGEDILNTSYHAQMYKQEVSSMHPQQVHVGMQKDEERMDVNRDEDGNEQPERRGTEKYFNRDAEHQDNERLHDVRPNMCEDLGGKQEVGQDYDPKPVSVDKHGDGERTEIDDQVDKDRKSGRGNGGGDSKDNMPKDNQRCKGEIRHGRPQDGLEGEDMHPQQVHVGMQKDEERMDVNRDEVGNEQPQRRGTEKYFNRDAEHQDNERLHDVRPNMCEDLGGKQDVGQDYDPKPVSVDKHGDGERMEIDDQVDKDRKSGRGNGGGDSKDNMPKDNQRCKGEIRHGRPQDGLEGEDMHPQQVHVGMQKDEERMDVNRDEVGNEQPQRRGTEKYFNRDAEHQDNERLHDVRPNMCEDLGGKQDVGQDYDPKPVSVDKHGDGERMEIDDQVDKDRKSGRGNGGGDSKDNMPKDNQRCKGEIRHGRPQDGLEGEDMHPQQVHVGMQKDEERMDVNRDEVGNEQPQRRGTEKYFNRDAEHQDNERLHDVRPNMCEDLGGKQDVGQDYDPKPVSVDKHGDGERMEIDDQVDKDRKSGRGNGGGDSKDNMPKDNQRCKGEISSRFYQRHGQPRDVKGDEQQKREDDKHAQRKGTSERLDDVKQNRSEHVSTHKDAAKQAKEQEKIGDDEHHQRGAGETYQGVQTSSDTKNITTETVAGTSQGGITSSVYNEGSVKTKSDQKTDAKVKLSEGVGNLKLNDSPSPKPQEQAVGKKHAEKKRGEKKRHWWCRSCPLKQKGKEKKKRNKTTGCFSALFS